MEDQLQEQWTQYVGFWTFLHLVLQDIFFGWGYLRIVLGAACELGFSKDDLYQITIRAFGY